MASEKRSPHSGDPTTTKSKERISDQVALTTSLHGRGNSNSNPHVACAPEDLLSFGPPLERNWHDFRPGAEVTPAVKEVSSEAGCRFYLGVTYTLFHPYYFASRRSKQNLPLTRSSSVIVCGLRQCSRLKNGAWLTDEKIRLLSQSGREFLPP